MALTQESILSFLLERGGKAKNSELLNKFRGLISGADPAEKQHNRDLFKKLVNSVAVVQQIDEVKFVVVKKRYRDFTREVPHRAPMDDSFSSQSSVFSYTPPRPAGMVYSDVENNDVSCPSQRRKARSRHVCGADDAAVKVLNLSGDRTSRAGKSGAVFAVIAVKPPPRASPPAAHDRSPAQERQDETAAKPVKLVTTVSTPPLPNLNSRGCKKGSGSASHWKNRQAEDMQPPGCPLVRPPNKTARQGDDPVCVPLEPLAHEWLVKCAAGQWGRVYGLLLQDTRLAHKKDFMSGFTALHWAAKDGNSKMVHKLMDVTMKGGTCLNINSKAHGGYTPLHIAAIHRHSEVIELLVQSYGASVNERDNSGKKACHYLGKGVPAEVRALLGGRQQGQNKERTGNEEYSDHSKGLITISKLLGKRQKPNKFAHDW